MKSIQQNLVLAILTGCLLYGSKLSSQSDSQNVKKSYFIAGVNYLSNDVYTGRKDSATLSYLRPSVGYYNKSGFHIDGGLAILLNSSYRTRIDMASIEAGYDFSIKDNFGGGVYASKLFYNAASFAVNSELKGLAGGYLNYNPGPISVEGGVNLGFSTNTDVSADFSLAHAFESGEENNKWTISPTAKLIAGTQYFNEAYYLYRKFTFETTASANTGKGKGKGRHSSSNGSASTTVKTVNYTDKNRFTILDYELSLPVNYETKRFEFYAVPVYAIPVNAASYTIDNVTQKENLSNTFFIEIGAYIKFGK